MQKKKVKKAVNVTTLNLQTQSRPALSDEILAMANGMLYKNTYYYEIYREIEKERIRVLESRPPSVIDSDLVSFL